MADVEEDVLLLLALRLAAVAEGGSGGGRPAAGSGGRQTADGGAGIFGSLTALDRVLSEMRGVGGRRRGCQFKGTDL